MMLGGVPHYLNQVRKNETPHTAINRLIFSKNGLLADEFNQLFTSLFGDAGIHKKIIELLAQHRYGLTREAILNKLKLPSSGWFTNILTELESSGFIDIQVPYSKKTKDALIKVVDNYCLFFEAFKKTSPHKIGIPCKTRNVGKFGAGLHLKIFVFTINIKLLQHWV